MVWIPSTQLEVLSEGGNTWLNQSSSYGWEFTHSPWSESHESSAVFDPWLLFFISNLWIVIIEFDAIYKFDAIMRIQVIFRSCTHWAVIVTHVNMWTLFQMTNTVLVNNILLCTLKTSYIFLQKALVKMYQPFSQHDTVFLIATDWNTRSEIPTVGACAGLYHGGWNCMFECSFLVYSSLMQKYFLT